MIYRFTINKPVRASAANIIANYLDLEHVPSHSRLADCRVLTETDRAACFLLTSRIGPFKFRNVHYFEYRPPRQILQVIKTVLGPMIVLATTHEKTRPPEPTFCTVQVDIELHLPWFVYPFRRLLRWVLERSDKRVLDEDNQILERRQRLFGDAADDYVQVEHRILFKETFRRHFANAANDRR